MRDRAGRYETELKERLYAIVADVAAAKGALPYVHQIADLKEGLA